MSSLRVLFVDRDARESEQICSVLAGASHLVLPASSLDEAGEALSLQKFDAVLLSPSVITDGLGEFGARLRQLEESHGSTDRIPVLCLSAESAKESKESANSRCVVDAYLPEPFEPVAFADAVSNLAKAVSGCTSGSITAGKELPVFEADEFQEQVGHDAELAAEIIDLFLSESGHQMPAMRDALERRNYLQLRPLAHTIKGSFGSLHAPRARARAQQLETAAGQCNAELCSTLLDALEADLEALKPELLALRGRA
jgi:HPt (histidine-containing phosphotransfer) domain-containing protein/CheY-like chemotaxis protein